MVLKGGIRVGWSSGKPFNPANQDRTDAIKDIIKRRKHGRIEQDCKLDKELEV